MSIRIATQVEAKYHGSNYVLADENDKALFGVPDPNLPPAQRNPWPYTAEEIAVLRALLPTIPDFEWLGIVWPSGDRKRNVACSLSLVMSRAFGTGELCDAYTNSEADGDVVAESWPVAVSAVTWAGEPVTWAGALVSWGH